MAVPTVLREPPSDASEPLPDPIQTYQVEDHIGFLLRRAHQRHASLFNEGIGDSALTPTQFAALIKTVQLGRVTQNYLGRLTAMDPATVQGVVRRLTERGLLSRAVDPLDRRSAVLAPTAAATSLVADAIACVRGIAAETLAPLTPAERTELARLLNKIA